MDQDYWENFYKAKGVTRKPSPFARFVLENHFKSENTVIELGCGNGRDSIFFADHLRLVVAIDQCQEEIEALTSEHGHERLKFVGGDFTQLGDIGTFDHVYSRFTLHSISEPQETDVLTWAHKTLRPQGTFLIEARGQNNELYKVGQPVEGQPHAFIHDNHYRRFINLEELVRKFEILDFEILMAEEKPGFSPYQGANETFIRLIAKKS